MTESTKIQAGAETIAAALTAAWNAGDGPAFAREFTADADFVNIFAMHVVGRQQIANIHQTIFDAIYKGSRNAFTVEQVRALGDQVAVAHVRANLHVPAGPMAGEVITLATAVLVRDGEGWQIDAFQNTRVQARPGPVAEFQ
jgi:uncharacterized protein (TIGR02246 family)